MVLGTLLGFWGKYWCAGPRSGLQQEWELQNANGPPHVQHEARKPTAEGKLANREN
jgi:hypothetical protein